LKTSLNLSSSEFLSRYTTRHTGPQSGLPVVSLKPEKSALMRCPFVTPSGCSVYDNRPSSCRTYPLARIVSRDRISGKLTERFMLIEEPHCKGFETTYTQSVEQWIDSQELAAYNDMNDRFLEILSVKNQRFPGPLDLSTTEKFIMACYDIDRFRKEVFDKGLLASTKFPEELLKDAVKDDTALLHIGFIWVNHTLFSNASA
jgi:Fe-S-cluster containining protein